MGARLTTLGAMAKLVLTVIGDDRPGLVSAVSGAVADHGGNWVEGQMARLAGKFVGIVLVDVPDERAGDLEAAVQARTDGLLDVTVTPTEQTGVPLGRTLRLHLLGNDRPGIVQHVSQVLAEHGVSIDELETVTREAPMGGGPLFETEAVLRAPEGVAVETLRAALEQIAGELMVDLELTSD